MMNRRNFLAAAAVAFAPAMFVRAAETKRKVVVVGGGLAGLSCAYELRKLGFEAIVLKGRDEQEAGSRRCARILIGPVGRDRSDTHSGYAPYDAGLCA